LLPHKELGSERIFLISNSSRPLRPRKRHQRRDVVAIGGAQRRDQLAATYLARVDTMKRRFLKIAAER